MALLGQKLGRRWGYSCERRLFGGAYIIAKNVKTKTYIGGDIMSEDVTNKYRGDPSVNVINLVGNAVKYLEDLHNVTEKNYDEKLKLYVEALRRESAVETDRINALRAVDVKAVEVANERAVKQAEVLDKNMLESAATLRESVAQTATTIAAQLQQIINPLLERVSALEKVNYENAGRISAAPDIPKLVTQLIEAQNINKGSSKGMREMWGWVVGGVMLLIAIGSFFIAH